MVGVTDRSMRSITPASSKRQNKSSGDAASAAACTRVRRHPDEDSRVWLDHRAVEHPRIAGPHPTDRVWINPVVEQPDARIGSGLSRTDDHVLRGRATKLDQFVDGHDVRPVGNAERRRRRCRYLRGQVAGVHHAPPAANLVTLVRIGATRTDPRRGSRSSGRRTPFRTQASARAAPGRSTRRSPAPSLARASRLRARPAGCAPRRAASRPRRRTRMPGGGGQRGRRPANVHRHHADGPP